jgi:hypothetical protein
MADYRKQFADALQAQGAATDPIEKQLESQIMANAGAERNITPTVALLDKWAGTNVASTLPKQESKKDKLMQLLQLKQGAAQNKLQGLGQLAKLQNDAEERSYERAFKEKMYGLQELSARAKLAKNAASAPRKLGSEDVKAVSYMDSILNNLSKLKAGLQQGQPLKMDILGYPVFGDNDASAARRNAVEAFGRNNSGGAIGVDEGRNFGNIISSLTDDDDMRLKKIDNLYNEILQRRNNYIKGPSVDYQGAGLPEATTRGPSANDSMDYDSMSPEALEALLAARRSK